MALSVLLSARGRNRLKLAEPKSTTVPTQKEKNLISKHVENVAAGAHPKAIGKVPIDTSAVGKSSDYYYDPPIGYKDDEDAAYLKASRREYMRGPHVYPIGEKNTPGMDLSRSWKDSNNPIAVAHEYYHARPTRNYAQIMKARRAGDEEHYADIFASQTDYNLKDVANFYNNSLKGKVRQPLKGDTHLDDQSRLRLFAGMAR